MAKTKHGKKASVKVKDMKAKNDPKGGAAVEYLKIKMEDVIVTSAATRKLATGALAQKVSPTAALKIK